MSEHRFTIDASRDLRAILEYYGEDSRAGRKLLDEITSKCRALANSPGTGHPCDHLAPGLRRGLGRDYLVFYRDKGTHIEIIRILHGRRDIPRIFDTE